MNYWTDNINTAITSKQGREISHLDYIFISRQVLGNRLLIRGELYRRTLKQDVLKQRPSSLASKNICVDCLAIVRLKLTDNRRPKHSLWLNKRYIWNSKTKIVNRSTQQRYRKSYRQNKSLSTAVQLSRPCWTDSVTCVRKLDNIVWSDASWDIWNSPLWRRRQQQQRRDVLWRTWTYQDKFSLLYLNMDKALKNSTQGQVA